MEKPTTSIPLKSENWAVVLEPILSTQIGWALGSAVGPTGIELINFFATDIPKHIKGIDKQADPFLEQLIPSLASLARQWRQNARPDEKDLSTTITLLKHLKQTKSPEEIFYPQIVKAVPVAKDQKIREEESAGIERKKEEAKKSAEKLVEEKVLPLLTVLTSYTSPSIVANEKISDILTKIGSLKQALDEVAHMQRFPIAKVIHLVKSVIEKYWDNIIHGKEPTKELKIRNHPLMELLHKIGQCANENNYYLSDEKKEIISSALHDLETLSPYFRGIHGFITSRIKKINEKKGLKKLHSLITRFIRLRVPITIENIKQRKVITALRSAALKKEIQGTPKKSASQKEIDAWARGFLKGDLTSYRQDSNFMKVINEASVFFIAYDHMASNIYKIYEETKRLQIEELPEDPTHNQIIEWGYGMLKKRESYKNTHPLLATLIFQMQEQPRQKKIYAQIRKFFRESYKKQLIEDIRVDVANKKEKLRESYKNDSSAKTEQLEKKTTEELDHLDHNRSILIDQVEKNHVWKDINKKDWAESFLKGNITPSPFKNPETADEVLWMAVAYQQQIEECERLEVEFQKGGEKTALCIMEALSHAIEYIETMSSIHLELKEEAKKTKLEKIDKHIGEWFNFARTEMLHATQDPFKQQEIGNAFDRARELRVLGERINAIKHIQKFIRESDFGKNIWKDEKSPLDELSKAFNLFTETPPPVRPPKSKAKVYETLNIPETTPWSNELLERATSIEKEQVIQDALGFSSFEFVAYCLGLQGKDKKKVYNRLIKSLDHIKALVETKKKLDGLFKVVEVEEKKTKHVNTIPIFEELKRIQGLRNVQEQYDHLLPIYNLESIINPPDHTRVALQKALEKVVGEGSKKCPVPNMETAIGALLERGSLNRDNDQDRRILSEVEKNITLFTTKEELHKELYFRLVDVLIDRSNAAGMIKLWKPIAKGFFRPLYEITNLFLQPYSKMIFEEIDGFFNGKIEKKHLVPIRTFNNAASTFVSTVRSWPQTLKDENDGTFTGDRTNDLRILLSRPNRLKKMTPREISLQVGYSFANKIKLPDYCSSIDGWIRGVGKNIPSNFFKNKYLNAPITGFNAVISLIPYTALYTLKAITYILMTTLNILIQQGVKFYLWKNDVVHKELEKFIAKFTGDGISGPESPILDSLILEYLQELQSELKKGLPQRQLELSGEDAQIEKLLRGSITHLYKLIRYNEYDSCSGVKDRDKDSQISKQFQTQIKKLSPFIISAAKSLLKKETVNELLFNLLKIGSDALRGGKLAILTEKQKMALSTKLGREPTKKEIKEEGEKIKKTAPQEIQKIIVDIQKTVINPTIDENIDQAFQTDSQLLLNYINWIQRRLLSYGGRSERTSNIIYFLKTKLKSYENAQDKITFLREIHLEYSKFIHEMKTFQTALDRKPSPHSSDLNQLIKKELIKPLNAITTALAKVVKDEKKEPATHTNEDLQNSLTLINEFNNVVVVNTKGKLNGIGRAELNRAIEMHSGVGGFIRTAISKTALQIKQQAKSLSHRAIELALPEVLGRVRKVYSDPIIFRHFCLWAGIAFTKPELIDPDIATRA